MSTRTIRDFKNFVKERTRTHQGSSTVIPKASREFYQKLNRLGWEKRTQDPEEAPDIDATAVLTSQEWSDLEREFRELPNPA